MLLPLFPLNTVLFPGMPLKLHIFEDRYKLMINACVEQQTPFGVVLLDDGVQVGQHDITPHPVGCTAMITRVQKLPGGRMNILSVGQKRFKINTLNYDYDYLAADVTIYPLKDTTPAYTKRAGAKLFTLIESYLKALQDAGQIQLDASQIPTEPIALCHLAAIILSVDAEAQQTLLETDNTKDLLGKLLKIYSMELALADRMRIEAAREDNGLPFSLN